MSGGDGDVTAVIHDVAPLVADRRWQEIERLLRAELSRQRNHPHLELLLGMVLFARHESDRARPYLWLAREHAPDDPYVLDNVAAFELWWGEKWAIERARETVMDRRDERPRSPPPQGWPDDVARDLRRALWRDKRVSKKLAAALVEQLQAENRPLHAFLREAAELDHEWAFEFCELEAQLNAMKRLRRA